MRKYHFLAIVLLGLLTLECSNDDGGSQVIPKIAVVQGVVYDIDTGVPLGGVRVVMGSMREFITDRTGLYAIEGISYGKHFIRATRPGYAEYSAIVNVNRSVFTHDIRMHGP